MCPACMASIGASAISAHAIMATSSIAAIAFFAISVSLTGRNPAHCDPNHTLLCLPARPGAQPPAAPSPRETSNQALQRAPQVPILKPISARLELRRLHMLARQKQLIGRHLSKRKSERKSRHRKNRRPPQHRSEHLRELRISHRIRRHHVHRPRQGLRPYHVLYSAHQIVNLNPAPPLPPRAYPPAQPEFERHQHFPEGSALRAQHQPGAQIYSAYASFRGDPARFFPLAAKLRQESLCASALLGQNFLAAVSIKPNRRRAHKHLWFGLRPRQSGSKVSRSEHSAFANRLFLFLSPTARNRFSGQVNHRIEPGEHAGRQPRPRRVSQRTPRNLARILGAAPRQADNLHALRLKRSRQRGANQSRSSADKDPVHVVNLFIMLLIWRMPHSREKVVSRRSPRKNNLPLR